MSDLVKELRNAAQQIRAENIDGWGNVCADAADRIEQLESQVRKLEATLERVRGLQPWTVFEAAQYKEGVLQQHFDRRHMSVGNPLMVPFDELRAALTEETP